MGAWRLSGGGASAALLVMLGLTLGTRATPPGPAPPRTSAGPRAAGPVRQASVGAGSCSAQACHGGIRPIRLPGTNVLRNEYTTWTTLDRHARAYQVLTGPRSRSIARNLGARTGRGIVPAHQDNRCLACHVGPAATLAAGLDRSTFLADGVGCESCHGPAADWLGEHTRYDWRDRSAAQKQARGMTPTRDLADRARACVGCHVGAPADPARGLMAREVNHDLITAGHPRLNFEFGAYLANLPKHWVEPEKTADFEARVWAIGQAETLRAALTLLETRARQASTEPAEAPWPEFAEYGCFSCHFDLKPTPKVRDPEQPIGQPTWASWYAPMALDLARQTGGDGPTIEAHLKPIRQAMSTPRPDAARVADLARRAVQAVDAWQASLGAERFEPGRLRAMLDAFGLDPERPVGSDRVYSWDHATQRYLARVALSQALTEQGADPGTSAALNALFQRLQFPKGSDSPRAESRGRP